MKRLPVLLGIFLLQGVALAQESKRLVLIDQDGSGPADSAQMSMMALLLAPRVEVLGITMVTGNAWRDEETRHTLRMLELIGRTDVPVVPGAVFPLVRTEAEMRLALQTGGRPAWLGAWGGRTAPGDASSSPASDPWRVPVLPEGSPKTKPLAEDAASFLVRQVRARPGQITIYAAGPLTNIALAISIEPRFAEMTRGIVIMGGSLSPRSDGAEPADNPRYETNPRYEFNFWFDPEAARIVLRAPWPRVDVTTIDVSIKAMFTDALYEAIGRSSTPAARYIKEFATDRYYLYDELAACAWLDPTLITRSLPLYMDVDLSQGPSYGHTLTWSKGFEPSTGVRMVNVQLDVDLPRFTRMFVDLMSSPR